MVCLILRDVDSQQVHVLGLGTVFLGSYNLPGRQELTCSVHSLECDPSLLCVLSS
jgi:hypothetical protein